MKMNSELRNFRVAVYRWECSSNDIEHECQHIAGVSDAEIMFSYCETKTITPVYTLIEDSPQTLEELKNLPELKRLMNLAKSGEIDAVLINRMYMFSSTIVGFYNMVKYFNHYKTHVICVDEPFHVQASDEGLIINPELI